MSDNTGKQYKYTDFNLQNKDITFDSESGKHLLISVPFTDDTPESIKCALNDLINQGIDDWIKSMRLEDYTIEPAKLSLNARIEITYDSVPGVTYAIVTTITGILSDVDIDVWIDKAMDIDSNSDLYKDIISYCRCKVENILFPQ